MNFDKLDAFIDSLGDMRVPARDVIITLNGERVYRRYAGHRDYEGREPMNGREAYNLYSATKLFTTACAMRLFEDGIIGLDDAVCDYLSEFSQYAGLTVRHLMSMQGGLDYDLTGLQIPGASTREIVKRMAARKPRFQPGTDFMYSLCHDALAAVVEVASGERFSDYLNKTIFAPLGMNSATFKITDYARENMCAQYIAALPAGYVPSLSDIPGAIARCELTPLDRFENIYRLSDEYESGGAGLICAAEDYSRFISAISVGGMGVLSPETIDLWRAPQLSGASQKSFDMFARKGYSYGLGVRTLVDGAASRSGVGEFGWDGAAGAYALIDPAKKLSIFFAMHVKNCFHAYYHIHPTLRDLTYEALEL